MDNIDFEKLADASLDKFGQYETIYGRHGALCFAFSWLALQRYFGYDARVNISCCHAFAVTLHNLIEKKYVDPQDIFNLYCTWYSEMIKGDSVDNASN